MSKYNKPDVRKGMEKWEIQKQCIYAATFSPGDEDVWWVVSLSEGEPCIATIRDDVCTDIRVYKTVEIAMTQFARESIDRLSHYSIHGRG